MRGHRACRALGAALLLGTLTASPLCAADTPGPEAPAAAAEAAPAPEEHVAPVQSPAVGADTVITPRASSSPSARVDSKVDGGFGSFRYLLVTLMLAGAAVWYVWRLRQGGVPGLGRIERGLAIVESRSLGNRQHLVVASYEGRKFLLGVCPGQINLLTPLDAPAQQRAPAAEEEAAK